MSKTYVGIDPGQSGGIAVIFPDGNATAWKMPETDKDIWEALTGWPAEAGEIFALIETVHAMPKQGVASTFKFGMGYGALRMALIASGIRHEGVRPQAWQKELGCLTGGDKNVSKARAQQLFPSLKITHALADALLIAEYARRKGL